MVLNVGIVSAFIVYKNRPGAMTRLQKLRKKLKQKPISFKILNSYPVKKLFSIFCIICFMVGMMLFLHEYQQQLSDKCAIKQLSKHQSPYLFPYHPQQMKMKIQDFKSQQNRVGSSQFEMHSQLIKVRNTVHTIVLFFLIPLIILTKELNFQRLIIKGKQIGDSNEISGHILKQKFGIITGWIQINNFICKQNDHVFIELCGQERFTNTSFHYAVKKVSQQQSSKNNSQSSPSMAGSFAQTQQISREDIIITKGNVYEARKTLIYICHIIKKQPNLNIKNAPIKQTKTKKLNKSKTSTRN